MAFLAIWQFLKANWKWIAVLLVLVSVFFAGWNIRADKCAADQLEAVNSALQEQQKVFLEQQAEADKKGRELEEKLRKQRDAIRVLSGRLKDEVDQNHVYRDCRPTAGGVQSINDAIASRAATETSR